MIYLFYLFSLILDDMEDIRQQAQSLAKSMNLSVVRLCFQAFLPDENGRFTIPVDPVFSHKVFDSSMLLFNLVVTKSGMLIWFKL